jgi:hypothetical protein
MCHSLIQILPRSLLMSENPYLQVEYPQITHDQVPT